MPYLCWFWAVAYPTKILFWKRITALDGYIYANLWLLLILQRYYFESESQQGYKVTELRHGCCLSYKDTILKANHSSPIHYIPIRPAVAYPTKILFWKRITATLLGAFGVASLLLILQRYYFESESQLEVIPYLCIAAVAYPTKILFWKRITAAEGGENVYISCCLSYKDTILKANHSRNGTTEPIRGAVAYPTKILFWKRITARNASVCRSVALLLILQRYYFESESQRVQGSENSKSSCCLSYKDTILKANHSDGELREHIQTLLLILQRYYFESESQRHQVFMVSKDAVAYPTKILFWKRITAGIP